ncbi:zinc-ribbon domain-containing protein [Streptomyces sp. NPDC002785]|uniref:zinc-ribbon domain-containing protein n=1 Tax=Streptomyces sp. NPDC002785 TaxID=3154543 RepID=UPI003332370D
MPSYCPFCGIPAPDEARFCMKCGRERPAAEAVPAAPPTMPDAPSRPPQLMPHQPAPDQHAPLQPPPPGHAPMPGSAGPTPFGAFLGRAFRGDWAGSAKAAAWPTGLILALAVALAIPSYGQDDDVVVGWSDRLRIALAMLLQAFGGGFEVRSTGPGAGLDGSGYGGSGYGSGGGAAQDGATLSVVPLTVTVLWVGALYLGARAARKQGGGMEAAVRISVVSTAAVLVIGLFAQPDVAGVSVSSTPLLAAFGALVISLLVTGGVLQRDASAQWLAARPVAHTAVRAAGTAVRALGAVLLLCILIGFLAYANADGVDGEAMLIALPLLPNIGLMVLGLSWGAPVEYDMRGQVSYLGSGLEHGGFGLSELGKELNGWAVAGALVTGVVCALTVGISAARRSADRREQATVGGLFLAMFLVLCGFSGVSIQLSGGVAGVGGQGMAELAPSVPDALLFGLLWVGGAVFVAPHLLRRLGRRTPMPTQPGVAPAAPTVPATPPPHYPHTMQLGAAPAPAPIPAPIAAPAPPAPLTDTRKRTALIWTGTLVAALLVGGGATAGVLTLTNGRSGVGPAEDDKPAASRNNQAPAADPSQEQTPSDSAAPSDSPAPSDSASASASPSAPTVPEGYRLVSDTAGFSFAVPTYWDRQSEKNHQIIYAGLTGRAQLKVGVIRNAPYTSYENFRTLERTADANQKNYRRLQLSANTFQGRQGAIWEYTYEDRDSGETIHAIDQSHIADDGTEYAVYTTERDAYWPGARQIFDTAVSTWMLNDID